MDKALIRSLKRRAKLRLSRARKKTLPKLQYPRAIETWYTLELVRLSKEISQTIRNTLFPVLERELRADADEKLIPIVRAIEGVRVVIGLRARSISRRVIRDVEAQNREAMNAQFKALMGVDIWSSPEGTGKILEKALRENIDLIESIPERQLRQVESVVREGLREGSRVETIKEDIQERFNVSESRARLIARDQVGKINGQLVEARNKELGIERYMWSTSHDERVRGNPGGLWPKGMHYDLDGKIFEWSDPPITNDDGDTNHPGEDYQCRCNALPLVEEVLESLGI